MDKELRCQFKAHGREAKRLGSEFTKTGRLRGHGINQSIERKTGAAWRQHHGIEKPGHDAEGSHGKNRHHQYNFYKDTPQFVEMAPECKVFGCQLFLVF